MYNKTIKCVKVLYYHPEFCYETLKYINILNKLFERKKKIQIRFFFHRKNKHNIYFYLTELPQTNLI